MRSNALLPPALPVAVFGWTLRDHRDTALGARGCSGHSSSRAPHCLKGPGLPQLPATGGCKFSADDAVTQGLRELILYLHTLGKPQRGLIRCVLVHLKSTGPVHASVTHGLARVAQGPLSGWGLPGTSGAGQELLLRTMPLCPSAVGRRRRVDELDLEPPQGQGHHGCHCKGRSHPCPPCVLARLRGMGARGHPVTLTGTQSHFVPRQLHRSTGTHGNSLSRSQAR